MADEPRKNIEEEGEWERLCWRAWLRGVRNYAALGRQFGKHWQTVKKAIKDQSEAVRLAIDSGDVEVLGEYVAGLAEDLGEAEKLHRESTNDNVQLGALKHMTELREKLAAAQGIVTKREGREHTGNGLFESILGNPVATDAAVRLAHALGNGDADAAEASGDADEGALPTSSSPEAP